MKEREIERENDQTQLDGSSSCSNLSCRVLSFRSSRCDGSAEPKGNPKHTNYFDTTLISTIKSGIPVSVSFISCRISCYICRVWCDQGCTTNREHGPNGRGMLLERRPVLHVLFLGVACRIKSWNAPTYGVFVKLDHSQREMQANLSSHFTKLGDVAEEE